MCQIFWLCGRQFAFLILHSIIVCFCPQDTDGDPLVIRNSGLAHRVAAEEGKDHVFTMKLFLTSWDMKLVKQSVQASKAFHTVDHNISDDIEA